MSTPRPSIVYAHACNRHTVAGARAALGALLGAARPASLLDVGCGTGTWLRAALDLGVPEVAGLDGIRLPTTSLHVPPDRITIRDLRDDWRVEQRYELVLCLEVAEHLPPASAEAFVARLATCGDRLFFSAANPLQYGQGHLNPQWPGYWQALFNRQGFACRDRPRWTIWENRDIEPWYRQNIFLAERDATAAGAEPRIPGVIHPDYLPIACEHWRVSRRGLLVAAAEALDRRVRRLLGRAPHG